jgi:predicted TIM-barrel fold metal-dependent hydrolase
VNLSCTNVRTDTHVHIFDERRFPYSPIRSYTPGPALVQDLVRHLERVGCERVVCVQPSVYGYDHACLLDSLGTLTAAGVQARGVAVLGPATTYFQLESLHAAGVRAARINWQVPIPGSEHQVKTLAQAVQALDQLLGRWPWSIEVFAQLPAILDAAPILAAVDRPVIIDHFGLPNIRVKDDIDSLLQMLETSPQMSLKLSAPYQVSRQDPDYSDLAPLVRRLGQIAPAQLLWGSNWPHTSGTRRDASTQGDGVEPFRYENDTRTLDLLTKYIADHHVVSAMLCRNPARVFDFV